MTRPRAAPFKLDAIGQRLGFQAELAAAAAGASAAEAVVADSESRHGHRDGGPGPQRRRHSISLGWYPGPAGHDHLEPCAFKVNVIPMIL